MKSPSSYSLIVLLAIGVCIIGLWGQSPASDEDGMDDAWETSMGLNPNDPTDAFGDKDGDRVPNLWEFARGTSANDASDVPEVDAYVYAGFEDPSSRVYPTLQAAYDSLQSLPEGQLGIIMVMAAATIKCQLDTLSHPRKVLWLAEQGPESVVLRAEHESDRLVFAEETVLDGFVIEPMPGVVPQAPALTFTSVEGIECRLVNTIIRRWRADFAGYGGNGVIVNNGAALTLLHCTVADSGSLSGVGYSIDQQQGSLSLVNSIVWNRYISTNAINGPLSQISATTSVVRGGVGGAVNVDPVLTLGGYLTAGSSICVAQGTPAAANAVIPRSVTGWDRVSYTTVVDIGADHWQNTDSDSLPNWWESAWFSVGVSDWGNLDDPDADELTNLDEFLAHTSPITPRTGNNGSGGSYEDWAYYPVFLVTGGSGPRTPNVDLDGDGLTDSFEKNHFGNSHYRNGKNDADEDGITDAEEALVGTSPQWWDTDPNNLRDVNPTSAHGTGAVKITSAVRPGHHLAR